MMQFNIYAGKKGKCEYVFTETCMNKLEAKLIAEYELLNKYLEEPNHLTFKDAIDEAKCEFDNDQDVINLASFIYIMYVFDWGEIKVIGTAEDSILEYDIILNENFKSDKSKIISPGN